MPSSDFDPDSFEDGFFVSRLDKQSSVRAVVNSVLLETQLRSMLAKARCCVARTSALRAKHNATQQIESIASKSLRVLLQSGRRGRVRRGPSSAAVSVPGQPQHTGKPNHASRSFSHQLQTELTKYQGDPLDSISGSFDEEDIYFSQHDDEIDLDYQVCCPCTCHALQPRPRRLARVSHVAIRTHAAV